ncbi:EamA-like transporter family protein [Alloyangia pacifica]|uniref:EamA-like transporter family protein n=1 Tax=Alloyangia pacifica TaxID=311180 RepID=A0A1I6V8B5_9RHOB|nr:EamA-like transporter family protein [Alloyangia pacifica]SFT09892.1 EamA-like transporter family protein [Alloyangia pacifica]
MIRTDAGRGHLAMLVFSAVVAGSFSLGAMAAPHIAPAALNAGRFLLATTVLGIVVAARGGVPRWALASPWRYLLIGTLMAIYFLLMFEGLKTAEPVSMSAVFTLTPVMAAGFGWLLMRQRMSRRIALGLTIGAAGALWVIFRADLAALLRFAPGRGEMIFFVGCTAHAVYAPLVPRLNRGEPGLVFTLGTMVAGTLVLVLWGWRDILATDWAGLPTIVWVTILYTTVAATALSTVLLQFAAMRLPSAKVMAYTYLIPSWVILWELGLGRSAPPALILVGIAMSVLAVLLLLRDG